IEIDGETEPVPVKLGVWLSNTKSRRDKLTPEQRAALAALGMEWAGVVPAAETAPEPLAPQPAPVAAPVRRRVREHHEECDGELHEDGNCTCWAIKRYGPPSDRESYGNDL
ncbi:helicase associated domain-containing protein, partial [Streptomyces sp. NPDC088090]|uniref:helicase associated domain-containing protein n=1 Tax=Streptomyces sp. NPDC088090 TaxID=3365822 RepID=UPI00384DDBDB